MRPDCIECVRKHFGSGVAVLPEVFLGYPSHITHVVGELDQAAQEAIFKYPSLSEEIREYRLAIEEAYGLLISGAKVGTAIGKIPSCESITQKIHDLLCMEAAEKADGEYKSADEE